MEQFRRLLNALFAVCLLALFGTPAFAADFVVSKTADTADGTCNADCSLREAIVAANGSPGADRIILGSGLTYTLTLGPADAPGAVAAGSGDLDITDALTIDGNGSAVDAASLDRVFDIQGSFLVTINSLTIKNGLASGFLSLGGGLSIRGATVVLNNSSVTGNSTAIETGARDAGGGIAAVGSFSTPGGVATLASLTLNNSTVSGNNGLNGGGILCVLCSLTITGSAISGNTASGGNGGGIDVVGNASVLSMTRSTLAGNGVTGAPAQGGGLSVPFGTSVSTLDRSRIVANTATTGSAIFESAGTAAATNNWWGCSSGPGTGGSGCVGTPNGIAGSVTSAPFLILTTTVSPASIGPGSSSTVTASLTLNSVSADTSAGGTVPNGIVAGFGGTLGTFATPTATTANGKAADLFTSNGVAGLSSVSATVDGQTLSATLSIVSPPIPIVTTGAAGPIHATGAYLQATVNPNGAATVAFQYGLTTSYGGTSLALSVAAGTSVVPVARLVSGLTCNTLYHFRAVATNVNGTAYGADATLTSAACGFSTRTLIWRHQATGQNAVWLMNGPALQTAALLPTLADLQWTIQATGDVNGDGHEDLVWRRTATGETAVWFLNGTSLAGSVFLSTVTDPNWAIRGLKDFDGDGKADLLWHNTVTGETAIWFLNGTGVASAAFAPTVADLSWDITGAADFSGDGKADLLWGNKVTGDHAIWLMNGATPTNMAFLPQTGDPTWAISGVGDLDGDGRADIVWRNTVSGENVCWFMNGATVGTGSYLPTLADPTWVIARVADIDGDGASDLVWRNHTTGDNALWQMNADQILATNFLPGVNDLNWDLVGK